MKIIIMGGGKLGFHLATNMLDRKYDVRLIERDRIKWKSSTETARSWKSWKMPTR